MGMGDKIDNKVQELKGDTKQTIGRATDNEEWQAEGAKDDMMGNLKQAGEKVKDAFRD